MAYIESSVLCPYRVWCALFHGLRRRGGSDRESGAFLLGDRRKGDLAVVRRLSFYDDIDPRSLSTGIVRLSGYAMNTVWQTCENAGLEVLADIHTHSHGASQSNSDQEHPMVASKGHLAMIAPQFARRTFDLANIGVYSYCGAKRWERLPAPRLGWRGIRFGGVR